MKKVLSLLVLTLCLLLIATFVSCDNAVPKGTKIKAPDFEIEDNVYKTSVSHDTDTYSFISAVKTTNKAEFSVYKDLECSEQIASKTTSLAVGDNTFYLLVTCDKEINLYTFVVRRRPIYTVTFNPNNGTQNIDYQYVEEGSLATKPSTTPPFDGCTFQNWNYDFSLPIQNDTTISASWKANEYTVSLNTNGGVCDIETTTVTFGARNTFPAPTRVGYSFSGWYAGSNNYNEMSWNIAKNNAVLTAKWTANTNTPYVVKYYQQNIENDEYTLFETKNYSGKSDASVKAPLISYDGFTSPASQTVRISADGTLVVEYYYTRNHYTLTFESNGGKAVSEWNLKYGASILSFPGATRDGFTFGGWYSDADLSTELTINSMPANDLTVFAWWQEETKPCLFKTANVVVYPHYIGGAKVTSINSSAFFNCASLTSITLPEDLTNIGDTAFRGCTGLTSISIGKNVTSIGDGAFLGCANLTNIIVVVGNSVYHSAGNCVIDTSSKTLVIGCKNSIIPTDGSVTNIGNYAFGNCADLKSITIPNNVTRIGEGSFLGCSNMTSLTLSSTVTIIEDFALCYCTSLTDITYQGTKAQWKDIIKYSHWNQNYDPHSSVLENLLFTVHCTDGNITYSSTH